MALLGFYILFWRYEVQLAIAAPVSFIIAMVVAIAFALSLAFRCVAALSATMITSQQGRIMLLSVITGLLVGGPLVSIMYNTNEASVTISCTADLAEEYGQDMVAAYKEAYNDMTKALIDNIKAWEKISDGIQTVLNPIRNGLKSAEKKFQEAENAVEAAAGKCQHGINEAYVNCGQGANNAYEQCKKKVPSFPDIGGKIGDIGGKIGGIGGKILGRKKRSSGNLNEICNLIRIGNAVCEPLKQVNVCKVLDAPKASVLKALLFGSGIFTNFAKLFNFKLSIDSSSSGELNSSVNHTEIKQRIREEFEEKYAGVLYVVFIVRIIFMLPIFGVPISSGFYLHKYLKCKTTGKSNCLSKFVKKQKKRDNSHLILQLIQLVTHILFSLTVICFDHTLFWIESVLKKHGNATFSAEGEVKLVFDSQGGQILKPIIDQFIETFTLKRTQNFTINTNRCLPEPTSASGLSTIVPIFVIYVCAFVFVFTEFYIASYRPRIINYFYPNPEPMVFGTKQVDMETRKVLIKNNN
jgi:hypothetical protein